MLAAIHEQIQRPSVKLPVVSEVRDTFHVAEDDSYHAHHRFVWVIP
jgi:hypothetical protein